jgi:hypothetical protein
MATHYLDVVYDFDFVLVGISSHIKDYRLAWSLNKALHWKLERRKDAEASQKSGTSRHALFVYNDPVDKALFSLIENGTEEGCFMPELAQWDFLLKADVPSGELDPNVIKKLREVSHVQAVLTLQIDRLKSKDNLIFS